MQLRAGPVRSPVEIKQASNPSERNEGLAVFADAKKEGPEIYHSGKKNGVGGGLNVAYGAAKNIGNRIKSWIGNMSRIRTVAFT